MGPGQPVSPGQPVTPAARFGIIGYVNTDPAELRKYLPPQAAHLPLTSAAEFRKEAWKLWRSRTPMTAGYLPRFGLRGLLASTFGFFAVAGLFYIPFARHRGSLEDWLLLAGLAVLATLLWWSKRRSNRKEDRQQELNDALAFASRRVDDAVEDGRLPLAPPGWQERIRPSLRDAGSRL